jgi:hypothetical protein
MQDSIYQLEVVATMNLERFITKRLSTAFEIRFLPKKQYYAYAIRCQRNYS